MPECPIEQAQTRVIASIAEHGVRAPAILRSVYSDDEIIQAAMKSMVFNSTHGAFVRGMVIKTIGMCEDFDGAINVLLPLLDSARAKNRAKYTSHTNFGNGRMEYSPDENEVVRANGLLAIASIVHRQNGGIKKPLAGKFGEIIVSAALLDPSPQMRNTAAYLLGSKGDKPILSLLLGHTSNADSAGNEEMYARGEAAIKTIVETMKEGGVRGTFLSVLLSLSTNGQEGNRLWELAEKSILEIYNAQPDMQRDILNHVIIENAKIKGIPDRALFGKRGLVVERYGHLLMEMGMCREAVETVEKKPKPTNSMRPVKSKRRPRRRRATLDEDEPVVVRGPAVELVMRAGRAIKKLVRDPRK